ncbi:MAG: group II truncated hemoglobin [Bdellovibrionales bacterium]|jgi:hemoglobin|nr:group II truncated hemoglobin [Bdellovibrionales bacterium]
MSDSNDPTNTTNHYQELGGAEGVESLVREFYRQMDTLPEVAGIRAMHPENLETSIEKLYFFLSGWLGGPQLYWEKYGHPRLRMRHMPFAIGHSESDQWLLCMERALAVRQVPTAHAVFLMDALRKVSLHMINR